MKQMKRTHHTPQEKAKLVVEVLRGERTINEIASESSIHPTMLTRWKKEEDSRESVNDTYLKAWTSMPPHKPSILSTYLGKITRQNSIDIRRKRGSKKRRDSEYTLSLSELAECVSMGDSPEQEFEFKLLANAINAYLRTLSLEVRNVFVGRYYFADSIKEIANYHDMGESKIKSMLYRTRLGLKTHLEKEGFLL